jgi:hypothetical protein
MSSQESTHRKDPLGCALAMLNVSSTGGVLPSLSCEGRKSGTNRIACGRICGVWNFLSANLPRLRTYVHMCMFVAVASPILYWASHVSCGEFGVPLIAANICTCARCIVHGNGQRMRKRKRRKICALVRMAPLLSFIPPPAPLFTPLLGTNVLSQQRDTKQ